MEYDRFAVKSEIRGQIVRRILTGQLGLLRHGIRTIGRIGALGRWSPLPAAAGGQQENSGKE